MAKMRVRAPRVKGLARSAAARGALGGRPMKTGTKQSRAKRSGSGKAKGGGGGAVFA